MPICPGCEQSLQHDELAVHERHCSDIWGERTDKGRSFERLERRLAALERRVDGRLREAEADFERRLQRLEQARHAGRRTGGK